MAASKSPYSLSLYCKARRLMPSARAASSRLLVTCMSVWRIRSFSTSASGVPGRTVNVVVLRSYRVIKIPRLEVAPDFSMVVVHTSTTEEGEEILADMAVHLEATLGFRDLMKTSRKRYGSNVVFEFDAGVEGAVQIIKELENVISPLLRDTTEINLEAKWDRISFSFDPLDIPPSKSHQPVTFLTTPGREAVEQS